MNLQLLQVLLAVGLLALVIVVILLVRKRGWPAWMGFNDKTLWDFMQLLIIPLAASSVAFVYSTYQEQAQRSIESNRTNEQILQSYFSEISGLILQYDLHDSGKTPQDLNARNIARARTVAAMGVLDGKRNGILLNFLSETELLSLLNGERLAVDLNGAVLRDAQLENISLNDSSLRDAMLVRTNLQKAFLLRADFRNANMQGVDLGGAALFGANFSGANLTGARLQGAFYDSTTRWPAGFDPLTAGAISTTVDEWKKGLP